jgi:hypothetical protein
MVEPKEIAAPRLNLRESSLPHYKLAKLGLTSSFFDI